MESKENNLIDWEDAISYMQLAIHTLQNSATDITPKSIKNEMEMHRKKFGTNEVKRLVKIILKEK